MVYSHNQPPTTTTLIVNTPCLETDALLSRRPVIKFSTATHSSAESDDSYEEYGPGHDDVMFVTVEVERSQPPRSLNAVSITFLAFFIVSGGPFGIEDAISSVGAFATLISLLVLPVVWAIPQALMTAELGTMIDQNGGAILWVTQAFGPLAGWQVAYCTQLSAIVDAAIYPVFFTDYLASAIDLEYYQLWLIRFGVVILGTLLNLRGVNVVTWMSALIAIIITIPFIAEIYYVATWPTPLAWYALREVVQPQNWGLFMNTVLFNYTGWDSLGSLAGEVTDGKRAFPLGIIGALGLITLNYGLPVILGAITFPDLSQWQPGTLQAIAANMAPWLGYWMLVASLLSSFALFMGNTTVYTRSLWSMGRPDVLETQSYLPQPLGKLWKRYNTPWVAILIFACTTTVLMSFSFELLVQVDVFMNNITLLYEFGSFICFKYTQPDRPRPFEVPLGVLGAWIMTIPKLFIVIMSMLFTDWKVWIVAVSYYLLVTAAYFVRAFLQKRGNCLPTERVDSALPTEIDQILEHPDMAEEFASSEYRL